MADLAESEWELGGVRFGGPIGREFAIADASLGDFAVDTQDVNLPFMDGVQPGRDRLRGATWSFTVFTAHTRDSASAYALTRKLTSAWRKNMSLAPGAVIPLRFCAGGRQLRVYGRPRRVSFQPPNLRAELGKITTSMDFQVMRPAIYEDGLGTEVLRMVQPSISGLVAPLVPPLVTNSLGDDAIMGRAYVSGDMPSPFTIRLKGPSSNATVKGDGWEISLAKSLAYDETCVIDTETQMVTVNGVTRPDMISRDTRLTARLKPGDNYFTYTATDPTYLSTATMTWRSCWSSL